MSTNIEILKSIKDTHDLANHSHPYAATSHDHLRLNYIDARSLGSREPSWYITNSRNGVSVELNNSTANGMPTNDGLYHVITTIPWIDTSGGIIQQAIHTASDNVYYRRSTSGSAWSSWTNLRDASSVGGYTAAQLITASSSSPINSVQTGFVNNATPTELQSGEDYFIFNITISPVNISKCLVLFTGGQATTAINAMTKTGSVTSYTLTARLINSTTLRLSSVAPTNAQFTGRWQVIEYK